MPTNQSAIDLITRTLALLALLCVLTVCALAVMGIKIPPELNTLAAGLVGSCSSMLVKTTPTDDKPKTNPPVPGVPAGGSQTTESSTVTTTKAPEPVLAEGSTIPRAKSEETVSVEV